MNVWVAVAAVLVVAGCDSGKKTTSGDTRVERCTDRLASGRGAQIREYARRTYCAPFAKRGWVYADGTFSIKAQIAALSYGSCSEGTPGGQTRTIPCKLEGPIDCGFLHYVRREEAQAYIRDLQRKHKVTCDDGTPLNELGAG